MKYFLALLLLSLFSLNSLALASEVRKVEDEITLELLQDDGEQLNYYNYNFGTVPVNFRHWVRFTITNNTREDVRYVNFYISGMFYSVNHYCYRTLRPRESCMAEIAFWPMQRGFYTGLFAIYFSGNNGLRINLQGQAF